MDNSADSELLEDSEEFDLKAREIVVSHCGYVHGSLKRKIANALCEAEQRGMRRAAEIAWNCGAIHVGKAIERAAAAPITQED